MALFDAPRRHALDEVAGYEARVLQELADKSGVLPTSFEEDRVSVSLNDAGPSNKTIFVKAVSSRPADAPAIIAAVSPLLFVTSYRCMDMFWEWYVNTINPKADTRHFDEKLRLLKGLDFSTAPIPSPLDRQRTVCAVIRDCYVVLMEMRHALVHRKWGTATNGDLIFDFADRQGRRIAVTIQYLQVIKLASLVGRATESVIADATDSLINRKVGEWLADGLVGLRGDTPKGLLPPMKETVSYTVAEQKPPIVIDLGDLARRVGRPSSQREPLMDLIVIGPATSGEVTQWRLPADVISGLDRVVLDDGWDGYLVRA